MTEKQESKPYQQQVYDSTFKSLLEDQPNEMLSFLVEGTEYLQELSESAQKPSLRVDRVYLVERIQKKMSDFNSLLDENSFVQKRRAEGVVEGEIKASQRAIITIVRGRFPALTELAQEQVAKIDKPDVLDYLIEQVSTAPDEAMVRHLLHPTAA